MIPASRMPLTLEDIAELINTNKREILTKVDGIVQDVNEVKSYVKVLNQRSDSQDKKNEKMEERFLMLENEILEMKKKSPVSFAQVVSSPPSLSSNHAPLAWGPVRANASNGDSDDQAIRNLISHAKKVIGLSPVDQEWIDLEKEKGIENDDEAQIAAARYYLTGEMNIPETTVEKMKIVKAFKPSTAEDTDRLYVEFEDESSVKILNRYKRNLSPGQRVFPWIPHSLYLRFKAIDDIAYQIRKVHQPFHQTDIRYEATDIAPYKRLNKSRRWEKVELHDLPDVCLDPTLLVTPSTTPPRGRSRQPKRQRSSSRSPVEENQATKTPRLNPTNNDESEREIIENPVEKSPEMDFGNVTETLSFSPANPAPPKHSMIKTAPGHIPLLKQSKLAYKSSQLPSSSKSLEKDFQ